MKKDVIYIDIEDDITSIISKVKEAEAKIVALVPPKRIGVLQSAVNLKLLQKAALGAQKRIVLITNDQSLTALAADIRVPVAKNLQTRPEVPTLTALKVDNDDVINGDEMPVGEIAEALTPESTAAAAAGTAAAKPKVSVPTFTRKLPGTAGATKGESLPVGSKVDLKGKKKLPSIPNFESFRKKLFILGPLAIAFIVFLVWAIAFAPRASIIITAKTSSLGIDRQLALKPSAQASDLAASPAVLKPTVQQLKKTTSIDFEATGTKDVGEKAKGSIKIRNCDSSDSFTLGAGTLFISQDSGHRFTADGNVTVSGFTGSASACRSTGAGAGTGTAAVSAIDIGPEYNIGAGTFTISGLSGDIYASSSEAMAGGTKEKVTVVSAEDVEKAKQQLTQQDVNAIKAELSKQFGSDFQVVGESFEGTPGQPSSAPAVGEQAKKAKLTLETVYTQMGIARTDIKALLDQDIKKQLEGKINQNVYSTGENDLQFAQFQPLSGGVYNIRMTTSASVGPKIDTKELAKQLKGMRYGEVQQMVSSIPGVEKVEINFWPFWVSQVPAEDKVDIKFSVVEK